MEVRGADLRLAPGDLVRPADVESNWTANFLRESRLRRRAPLISIPFGRVWDESVSRFKSYIRDRYQQHPWGVKRLRLAGKTLASSRFMSDYSQHLQLSLQVGTVSLQDYAYPITEADTQDDFGNFTEDDYKKPSPIYLDLWDPRLRMPGVVHISSNTQQRNPHESVENYLARHINEILTQIYERYESGTGAAKSSHVIYGVWVNIITPAIPRGMENVPSAEEITSYRSSKVVYFPPTTEGCFWWCLASAVYNEGKRVTKTQAMTTRARVCELMGESEQEYEDMPYNLDMIRRVCQVLHLDITIINKDRRILFQSNSDRSLADGINEEHLLLFLYENYSEVINDYLAHWCWVRNYTSFLPTLNCHVCGTTFTRACSLERHLQQRSCLRCQCLKRGKTFRSVAAYKHHKANLNTLCPVYNAALTHEPIQRGLTTTFLKATKGDKNDPERMPDRMWSGDMESIVPSQLQEATASTGATHVPYAWAHYESFPIVDLPDSVHETVQHVERSELYMYYGPDCLEDFYNRLEEVKLEIYNAALPRYTNNIKRRLVGNSRAVQKFRSKIRGTVNETFRDTDFSNTSDCPMCNTHFVDKQALRVHLSGGGTTANISECGASWYGRRCLNYSFFPKHTFPARILPKVWVYCHNGAGYDFQFIMRLLRRHYTADRFEVLMSDTGRVLGIDLMGLYYFRDPVETLKGSLRSLAKSFQVEVQKGYFPYTAITMDDIYSVLGPDRIDADHMHETEKIEGMPIRRSFNETEMASFWEKWPEGFDVEQATREYLADDVIALHQILCKVMLSWNSFIGTDFRDAMTAAGHAFKVYRNKLMPADTYAIVTPEENDIMRNAYHGGRTEVFVRGLTIEQQEAIAQGRAMLKYLDQNGMYSACHKKPHPSSHPTHIGTEDHPFIQKMLELGNPRVEVKSLEDMDAIRDHLNHHKGFNEEGFLHIVWVNLVPPQDLYMPIVPERRDMKTMFTLDAKINYACCTPELELCLKKGYEVSKVHLVMRFQAGYPFSTYVDHIIGKKIEAKRMGDSVKALIAKLLANSLYGRTGMGSKSRNVLVDTNARALIMAQEPGHQTCVKPFSRERNAHGDMVDWALVTQTPIRSNNRTSNLSLASFTTSYARASWYEMADRIESMTERVEGVTSSFVLYGDTDSVIAYFEYKTPEAMEDLTDQNGDPEDLGYLLDDLELGKWKDEFRGHTPPLDIVCVAPKLYFFKFGDGSEKGAAKGVQLALSYKPGDMVMGRNGFAEGINYATAKALVRGEIRGIHTTAELWFTHSLTAVGTLMKCRTLSGLYTKRVILENGLNTRPYKLDDRCAFERALQLGDLGYTGLEDLWLAVEEEDANEASTAAAAAAAAFPASDEMLISALGKRQFEELDNPDEDDAVLLGASLPPASRHMAVIDDEDMADIYELLSAVPDPME